MSAWKPRRRLIALALVVAVAVAALGAVGAYGYYALDWGCPSNEELERPLSAGEVEAAFAPNGLTLVPARLPIAIPPGATSYRREAEGATLFVVVCKGLCGEGGPVRLPDLSRVVFGSERGGPRTPRHGWELLNVGIWVADADRRSAQSLVPRLSPIVDDLSSTIPPDDRCYVR